MLWSSLVGRGGAWLTIGSCRDSVCSGTAEGSMEGGGATMGWN